ncbi:hypothetical protein [Lonsdalea quercina]|uniref:hypothetical protein n=1 Tax=Lonsdalea quercina TaxID=71657 RepID=UPI003974B93B
MKKAKAFLFMAAALAVSLKGYCESGKVTVAEEVRIPAIKLINVEGDNSSFVKGSIPVLEKIPTQKFWISNSTEDWEKNTHAAPRKQYVITLKGTLKFKVSNGSTFIIAPGTVLLAEDLKGPGHSWEIIDGNEWVRAYIPMEGDKDYFTSDK